MRRVQNLIERLTKIFVWLVIKVPSSLSKRAGLHRKCQNVHRTREQNDRCRHWSLVFPRHHCLRYCLHIVLVIVVIMVRKRCGYVITCLLLVAVLVNRDQVHRAMMVATTQDERLAALVVDSHAHILVAPPTKNNSTIPIIQQQLEDYTTFSADNLKSSKKVVCGAYKCFFSLKHDESMGYLVTPATTKRIVQQMGYPDEWFYILTKSWEYAKYLEKEYNIQHFLLEAPTKAVVTPQLEARLNRNLRMLGRNGNHGMKTHKRYREGSTVYIQKVQTAPEPHLFLGGQERKRRHFSKHFGEFFESTDDKEAFCVQFAKSIQDTRELLQKEPKFAYDFQALVDTNGTLFHLDFERFIQPTATNETKLIFRALNKFERHVRRTLHEWRESSK